MEEDDQEVTRDKSFIPTNRWVIRARRRIRTLNTEEKAKVVAAVWGTEVIQFLATLGILRDDLKNRMKSSYPRTKSSFILQIVLQNSYSVARN